jgi:pyocin large subunit-like protein
VAELTCPDRDDSLPAAKGNTDTGGQTGGADPNQGPFKNNFKSQEKLDEHYEKHKSEFGNISKDEYLQGARNLVNSEGSDNVLIKIRPNGDVLYYNRATNEFAITDSDGVIRTYFKPVDGIDYFNAQ